MRIYRPFIFLLELSTEALAVNGRNREDFNANGNVTLECLSQYANISQRNTSINVTTLTKKRVLFDNGQTCPRRIVIFIERVARSVVSFDKIRS